MAPKRYKSLAIIVPSTGKKPCGLADHAHVIARELTTSEINVAILPWSRRIQLPARSAVLLEYTPLAYSRLGLPWLLLWQIANWKLRGLHVVLFFHEVPFANGVSPKKKLAVILQSLFCLALTTFSAEIVVNQHSPLGWIGLLRPGSKPCFIPSCSNIGEAEDAKSPDMRPLSVVIFGSPGKRRHAHALVAAHGGYRKIFGPDVKVIDIGEHLALPEAVAPEVLAVGCLPDQEVLARLSESRFGFFFSEPLQFSKSGVFAAYCATGVIPVIASTETLLSPYFLSLDELASQSFRDSRLLEVWTSGRSWHNRYSVQECARLLRGLLCVNA
jgi:hypothetical protein